MLLLVSNNRGVLVIAEERDHKKLSQLFLNIRMWVGQNLSLEKKLHCNTCKFQPRENCTQHLSIQFSDMQKTVLVGIVIIVVTKNLKCHSLFLYFHRLSLLKMGGGTYSPSALENQTNFII